MARISGIGKGTNFEAKVVLPDPGKPIIKIFLLNFFIDSSVRKKINKKKNYRIIFTK